MNNLLARLVASPGVYRGTGDGPESGPFAARLEVRVAADGRAAVLDYESVGADQVSRMDHVMLAEDERSRLEAYVVTDELPGVARFTQAEPGVFVVYEPIKAKIVITMDDAGELTYAWWWTRDDAPARAQSKAVLRRSPA